jgi:hypothetical protein
MSSVFAMHASRPISSTLRILYGVHMVSERHSHGVRMVRVRCQCSVRYWLVWCWYDVCLYGLHLLSVCYQRPQ